MDRLDTYLEWGTRTPTLDRWWVTHAINTDNLALLEALMSMQMVDYTSLYGSYGTAYTTALCLAVQLRRRAMVSLLVDTVPLDEEDFRGVTPLYLAVDTDQDDIAMTLIGFGADVNIGRVSPFFNAVYRKNVGLAAVMLVHGADIDATYGEWSAMAMAVNNNDLSMVEMLMRWSVDWQADLEFLISVAIEIRSTEMLVVLTKDLNRETCDATPYVREAVNKGWTFALDFFAPFKVFGPMHVTSIYPQAVRGWIDTKKVEKDMARLMTKFVGVDMGHVIESFLVPAWTIHDPGEVFILV